MRTRFIDTVDFWRFLLRRFLADQGPNNAAALTYTTLFAVVPMMTVTFAMLSAVPAFQNMGELIQSFIFRNFVPTTGSAIEEYLRLFTVQARQLTWVGIAFLLITALLMLLTIEKVFNTIWRVHQPRRGITSFLIYWAILSLGPLLLGAGFALSTYIASLSLISGPHPLIGAGTLLKYMPLLLSVAAFTLLYAAVPNTRVPLGHSLVGGVFAAVLFEAAKKVFSFYVGFFPGYQLIYGAFATVPLFLLWIYLSWMIVLLGAELVCNLSSSREWRNREVPRLLAAFGALRVFHQRQQSGRPVRHTDMRSAGWPMPEDEWVEVVEFLESQRLVCRTSGGAWVLCRDLGSYPVHLLIGHSPWPLPRVEQLPDKPGEHWLAPLREALAKLQDEQVELFGDNLADWLQPESRGER